MAMWLRADVNAQKTDDAFDGRCGDLKLREAEDAPAGQCRLQILLGVGGEALRAIVAALDVDAALDLDERAALDVGEVSTPFALSVKSNLSLQRRSTERLPVEQETAFQP